LNNVQLLDHQYQFVHSDAKVCGLISGVGAGKSFAGRVYIIKRAIDNPETLGFIGANTYSQLRDTVLVPLFADLDMMGLPYDYNGNTGMLTLGNAQIKCASMENYNILRGIEIGWAYIDEIRDLKEEAFMMLLGRLRDKRSHALEMRATTTPNGFDWIYDLFAGERKTDDFAMIHAISSANPFLPKGYLDTLTANYDEKFALQELSGEFVSLTSGKVYHAFSRNAHVEKRPDMLGSSLIVGMDFNVNPMTASIAVVNSQRIHFIDEIYLKDSNTFAVAREIRKKYPRHYVTIIPDATGKNRKTSAISSDHAILQAEGFDVRSPRANPLREDRHNTVNRLFSDGKIRIAPECKMLIKDLEQEVHGKNPADIGHLNDGLGYLCYWYQPLKPLRKKSSTIRFT